VLLLVLPTLISVLSMAVSVGAETALVPELSPRRTATVQCYVPGIQPLTAAQATA